MARKVLKVPYHKQGLKHSCFPCGVRMIGAFFGKPEQEKGLYLAGKLAGHPGVWDAPIARRLIGKGWKVVTYWDGKIEGWGISKKTVREYNQEYRIAVKEGMEHKHGATLKTIKDWIRHGVPVLTEVDANKFYCGKFDCTHMVLIVGFDDIGFILHDPEPHFGMRNVRITYSWFKKSWEHLGKHAGRSLFVLYPKKTLNSQSLRNQSCTR